jgi:hypothetical protein
VRVPILLGGGVTEENVVEALNTAQGVIVSSSLMRRGIASNALMRWDADRTRRLMDRARAATG